MTENINDIKITRGDTFPISLTIFNDFTQSLYELGNSDVVRLTVKIGEDMVVQKVVGASGQDKESRRIFFKFDPEDTDNLSTGKYHYDVELETGGGEVFTVVKDSIFWITRDITAPNNRSALL